MKNSIMNIGLASMAFGMGALISPLTAATGVQNDENCSAETLLSYFPDQFVAQTLESFKVPQAQREAIQKDLANKNQEVIATVEERAGKMSPNPLRDPQHRQEAVKVFRDTLYDLFSSVMQAHGINDKQQIQAMLDDIQQQKAKYFSKCMDKNRNEGNANPAEVQTQPKQTFTRQPQGPNDAQRSNSDDEEDD